MKYGIYYAYWEKKWGADYQKYVKKVKDLGFDILEVSCAGLRHTSEDMILKLKECADENGIMLTGGYGPRPDENIASADSAIVANAFRFWEETFPVLYKLGILLLAGRLFKLIG